MKISKNSCLTLPTPWINVPDDIGKYAGFVYEITNLFTGRKYIGRKVFWNYYHAPPLKGRKNRRRKRKESDWRTYKSSCKELKQDIHKQGLQDFQFRILNCYKTRAELVWHEGKEQVLRDVLYRKLSNGDYRYYNQLIAIKARR